MQKSYLKLDINDRLAKADDRLFSSFIEHMGRAVYTGIYEPDHPAADEKGFRNDVKDLIRPLNLAYVRYPGGNFLSGYNWKDGIGPKESRPVRPDLAWFALEPNQVGTDEFLPWCEEMGIEPMMAVNLGTGTPQSAMDLLEYCNSDLPTYWADQRRANGHKAPYNVKLWCLGNEMDGPWQICGKTAREYARTAHETAKMMKWLDPSIELVACGSSNKDMPTFGEWERTVLMECWDQIDYLSLHTYYGNKEDDLASFLARSTEMDSFIEQVSGICRQVKEEKGSDKNVYLSFDEWNVWYHWQKEGKTAEKWVVGRPIEEEEYDLTDALVVGCMINSLLNHADTVKIACLAQLVNVLSAISTEPGGKAWAQSIYYPFLYASLNGRGTVLRQTPECGSYSCAVSSSVPYLDTAAVLSDDGKHVSLFAVNRSQTEKMELSVSLKGISDASICTMCGDPLAINTPDCTAVKPEEGPAPEFDANGARAVLEPLSWNLIRFTL